MNWYALQVRARYEEVARTSIEARGLDVFLPTRPSARGWSDKIRRATQPLFPGYLFFRSELTPFTDLLYIPGTIDLVRQGEQAAPVDRTEVDSLQRLVGTKMRILDHPFVEAGNPVQILHGPLRDVVGTIIRRGVENHLILSISVLRRSVAVQLHPSWLKAEGTSKNTSAPLDFETPRGRRQVSSV